jgi:galactose mutarotase-like enzyme
MATDVEPLRIADPTGRLAAEFIPGLGMVGVSLQHEGEELLAQLGGAEAYAERLKTFALPLLYPWANRLNAWEYTALGEHVVLDREAPFISIENGLPIHGLLSACSDWQVVSHTGDTLVAELDFASPAPYFASFPFPHRLRYTARAEGDEGDDVVLVISVTVTATDASPVPISFGFHPYLTLPGSDRREWRIDLPVAVRALVDDNHIPTGETVTVAPGELDGALGDRTFDDSFPELRPPMAGGADPVVFSVADNNRRISVEHRIGCPVAQVFTPEAADFICFEPMTAPVDALRTGERLPLVQPEEQFTAEFAIRVTRP